MNLERIRSQRDSILEVATRYGASNIRIFGSTARKESTESSDIDFLIELETQRTLFDQISLIQELEALLGCKVDVVEPSCLHEVIRRQVLQEAVPL